MKEKFKEFIQNLKLAIIIILILVCCISGIIAEMWPETQFNYPILVCAISGILLAIVVKLL